MESADIILSRELALEPQIKAILAVAGPEHAQDVHWRPRPDVPHGGVYQAPAHVAEAYRRSLAPAEAELEPEEEPDVEETDPEQVDPPQDPATPPSGAEGTGTDPEASTEQAASTTSRRGRRRPAGEGSAE